VVPETRTRRILNLPYTGMIDPSVAVQREQHRRLSRCMELYHYGKKTTALKLSFIGGP
jgi:hypothetical protein